MKDCSFFLINFFHSSVCHPSDYKVRMVHKSLLFKFSQSEGPRLLRILSINIPDSFNAAV